MADAVRRSRRAWAMNAAHRQLSFLGTVRRGQTELARRSADVLFNDEKAMTRIDMSERYQERHP